MTPLEAAVPSGRDESILEHAVRAIYAADPQLGPDGPVPWDQQHTPLRAVCIAQARAAIEAIRPMSEDMRRDAIVWDAIIDAINMPARRTQDALMAIDPPMATQHQPDATPAPRGARTPREGTTSMTEQWEVTFQKVEKVPAIAPEGWEPFAISPSSDCTVAGIWLRRRVRTEQERLADHVAPAA
jgi:hypothetical protein